VTPEDNNDKLRLFFLCVVAILLLLWFASTGRAATTGVGEGVNPGTYYLRAPQKISLDPTTSYVSQENGYSVVKYHLVIRTSDNTGSGHGWHETLSASSFTNGTGESLGAAFVTSVDVTDAPRSTNTEPSDQGREIASAVALSSKPATILVADKDTGMGNFIVGITITVELPLTVSPGSYMSHLRFNLVPGP
jgi:hypothetical protein